MFFEDHGREVAQGTQQVYQGHEVELIGDVFEDSRMENGSTLGCVL